MQPLDVGSQGSELHRKRPRWTWGGDGGEAANRPQHTHTHSLLQTITDLKRDYRLELQLTRFAWYKVPLPIKGRVPERFFSHVFKDRKVLFWRKWKSTWENMRLWDWRAQWHFEGLFSGRVLHLCWWGKRQTKGREGAKVQARETGGRACGGTRVPQCRVIDMPNAESTHILNICFLMKASWHWYEYGFVT